MGHRVVGIDLGGTWIRAAVSLGGTRHSEIVRRETPASDGPAAIFDVCAEAATTACRGHQLDGVTIGIPGPLDPRAGVVYAAPQLPGFDGINARDLLQERLDCPVAIQNDASLAGYAEWTGGTGQGTLDFVYITASTGIGGALVMGGVLQDGAVGTAGEIGHMAAERNGRFCGSGHRGCVEALASGAAIAETARRELAAGASSTLSALDPLALRAIDVHHAAEKGDELSIRIFRDAGHALGRAVGGLINLLSPEVIAIGGGLSNAGELLFASMREGIAELAFDIPAQRCRVGRAALGTEAGMIGAVAWAAAQFGRRATRASKTAA